MGLISRIKLHQRMHDRQKLAYDIRSYLLSTPIYAKKTGVVENSVDYYIEFLKLYERIMVPVYGQVFDLIPPERLEYTCWKLRKRVDFSEIKENPEKFLQDV